jgi:hypothetical protein
MQIGQAHCFKPTLKTMKVGKSKAFDYPFDGNFRLIGDWQ